MLLGCIGARRDALPCVRYGPVSSVEGLAHYLKPSAYCTYLLTLATTVARWGRRPARAHHPGRLEQDRPESVPLLVHGFQVLLPCYYYQILWGNLLP